MTTGITDRAVIHCCDCGGYFFINTIANDCTEPTIRCPHCGRNGINVKECRR